MLTWANDHVRFGSLADITGSRRYVCFAPESGNRLSRWPCCAASPTEAGGDLWMSSCYFGYAAALETALFAASAMSAATACGFET